MSVFFHDKKHSTNQEDKELIQIQRIYKKNVQLISHLVVESKTRKSTGVIVTISVQHCTRSSN